MKNFVQFAFGKPYERSEKFTNKFLRFYYWAAVVFYFFYIIQQLLSFVMKPSGEIIYMIITLVLFPVIFRIVYKFVGYPHDLKREE
jgi:hypothetical protein